MNDWWKPCEHGRYEPHVYRTANVIGAFSEQWSDRDCPGGSPVTAADLEGEKVWWCEKHDDARWRSAYNTTAPNVCSFAYQFQRRHPADCQMVERLLIPIPDPQSATEGT